MALRSELSDGTFSDLKFRTLTLSRLLADSMIFILPKTIEPLGYQMVKLVRFNFIENIDHDRIDLFILGQDCIGSSATVEEVSTGSAIQQILPVTAKESIVPASPRSASLPRPPSIRSFPKPPRMRSLPHHHSIDRFPWLPWMRSFP